MSDFVSWCRHLLVPFFFMKRHPYIPLHFIEMIFPLIFHSFFRGIFVFAPCAHRFMHADNAPLLRACNACACYGVVQCLPMKSPTIYRRNLRRSLGVRVHLHRLWRRLVKKISAEACSGKEIAGLLRKIMMILMMNMMTRKS